MVETNSEVAGPVFPHKAVVGHCPLKLRVCARDHVEIGRRKLPGRKNRYRRSTHQNCVPASGPVVALENESELFERSKIGLRKCHLPPQITRCGCPSFGLREICNGLWFVVTLLVNDILKNDHDAFSVVYNLIVYDQLLGNFLLQALNEQILYQRERHGSSYSDDNLKYMLGRILSHCWPILSLHSFNVGRIEISDKILSVVKLLFRTLNGIHSETIFYH
jgi:hypothetical protein